MMRIIELNTHSAAIGRCSIKVVLHEIYPDRTQWNENGITYLEQYTRDNADSIKGMPLCAEFLDDNKDVPYGHGLTGHIGNMPVFEDSVQVGAFEDWSIEDIEIDGEVHKCLCATGYINESRYPHFVEWLVSEINKGNHVYGSVEFVGTKDNKGEIIYEDEWKKHGRIPMVYDYIGYCIVGIRPADATAVLLSIAQGEDCTNSDLFDDVFGDGSNTESNSKIQEDKLTKSEFDDLIAWTLNHESTDTESIDFDDIFI